MVKTCAALYKHSSYMDCIISKHSIIAFLKYVAEEINLGLMWCGVPWRTSDPTQEGIACLPLLSDEDLPNLPDSLLHLPLDLPPQLFNLRGERGDDVDHNVLGFLMARDGPHRWL